MEDLELVDAGRTKFLDGSPAVVSTEFRTSRGDQDDPGVRSSGQLDEPRIDTLVERATAARNDGAPLGTDAGSRAYLCFRGNDSTQRRDQCDQESGPSYPMTGYP